MSFILLLYIFIHKSSSLIFSIILLCSHIFINVKKIIWERRSVFLSQSFLVQVFCFDLLIIMFLVYYFAYWWFQILRQNFLCLSYEEELSVLDLNFELIECIDFFWELNLSMLSFSVSYFSSHIVFF